MTARRAVALLLAASPLAVQVACSGAGSASARPQLAPDVASARPDAAAATSAAHPEIAISGGTLQAGQRRGPTSDTVVYERVEPFLLDATEVTVSAYAACVHAGRCAPAATTVQMEGLSAAEAARWSAACNGDRPDRAEHPVNCVDWPQAQAYCAFAGKRLPSEAEWEWAARGGGTGIAYPWGNDPPADRACWGGPGNETGGPRSGTCPVAAHPRGATPSGVQDLAGNVWEWTSSEDVVGADSRGRGGTPVKIARGGGWSTTTPAELTAAIRAKNLPSMRAADLGFRCARRR